MVDGGVDVGFWEVVPEGASVVEELLGFPTTEGFSMEGESKWLTEPRSGTV